MFRPADGAGFWMAPLIGTALRAAPPSVARAAALEKPKRSSEQKAQPEVDAAKDKALLDAFSAAITSALAT